MTDDQTTKWQRAHDTLVLMTRLVTCPLCQAYPAHGIAEIDGQRYCHGDDDASPTCYEQAQSGVCHDRP